MMLTAGLGLKLEHLDAALAARDPGLWFEVHSENYMMDGGPRLAALEAVRRERPVSLHGVGLSLASTTPPSSGHVERLARLAARIEPWVVSDHLAWTRWGDVEHGDFLPFPRSRQALDCVVANIQRVQDALRRPLLIENPSTYLDLPGHELDEASFLAEMVRRSGCGLLLDVNNAFVSAHNLDGDAAAFLDALPGEAIGEIHLAGHSPDPEGATGLLIDTHDAPVAEPVWRLYARLIDRIGARPTLIERDDRLPPFDELMIERDRAAALLAARRAAVGLIGA
ncbi:MAG: DUF692 domain-containing protein [Pseudomonadota bacterium]